MPIQNKKIDSSDLLDLNTYTKERKAIRSELVEMKKNRRVELGPHSTFYFENFFTMKAQIQEMLYIEKGGDEQLKDELDAYNPLIPQGNELVATFMFEIDNPITRKKVLSSLGNVENTIFISVNGIKYLQRLKVMLIVLMILAKHPLFTFYILNLKINISKISKIRKIELK